MAWQRGFSRKEHPATKADFEATAQRQRRESLRCQTCRAHSRADTMSRRQTASKTAAISNQRQCKCHASKRRAMPNQPNGGRKSARSSRLRAAAIARSSRECSGVAMRDARHAVSAPVVIDDTSCKGTEFFGSRDAGRSTCCLGFGDSLWARALRVLSFVIRSPLPKLDTHVARATRLFSITNRNRLSTQDLDTGQLLRSPG